MRKLHVVVGTETVTVEGPDGEPAEGIDEAWHEFEGDHVSWMTEPSGVLNIFRRPNDQWASYAPGEWKAVRDASGQD